MPIITRPSGRSTLDEARGARGVLGIVGVVAIALGTLLGFTATAAVADANKPVSTQFHTDGANSYTNLAALNPSCNGIFGTPGSFPSSKAIVSVDGSTIHYVFHDNPARTDPAFQVQDCVLTYPASFFNASDFNADGTLKPGSYTKHDLSGGTELDTATLSGSSDSVNDITYKWDIPASVAGGTWICNFARDVNDQHQGGGNRKAVPACYQVPEAPGTVTASVTFNDPTCDNQNTASWDGSNTDEITYTVTSGSATPGSPIEVTASLKDGVDEEMVGGPTFTHTYTAAASCGENPGTVTAGVTFTDPSCGNGNVTSWLGTNTDKLTYAVTSGSATPGSAIEVTATKKVGVNDTLTGQTVFTHRYTSAVSCGGVVTFVPDIPTTTTTTVAPTTTTTTAAPELGFTPTPEVEPLVITAPPAAAPELPLTGDRTAVQSLFAIGLLGLGSVLIAASRRKQQPVRERLND